MASEAPAYTGSTPYPTEAQKLAAIRAELPAVTERVYLNAGTNGPMTRRSHDALAAYALREMRDGRIIPETFTRMLETRQAARAAFAALLGCDVSEVALTHNTTEGMNIALMGLDWARGDEIVTANTEHPGGLYPAYLIKQRYGVKLRMTAIGAPDRDPVEELRQALTPRTRAVVLSHVSWSTGRVLPVRELADLAHAAGALLICDAAQSAGMVPTRMAELGVDAYACSGQKWLCGPDGTGALFVRRDRLAEIQQTFIGYGGVAVSDLEGHFVPPAAAQRFEATSLYPPTVQALVTSLDWLAGEVGWEWAHRRIAQLGRACYAALAAIPGVTIYTPYEAMAGLIHFTVDGIAPAELTQRLCEQGILIRNTPNPLANRVATGFYNTQEDLDRLVEGIEALRLGR